MFLARSLTFTNWKWKKKVQVQGIPFFSSASFNILVTQKIQILSKKPIQQRHLPLRNEDLMKKYKVRKTNQHMNKENRRGTESKQMRQKEEKVREGKK